MKQFTILLALVFVGWSAPIRAQETKTEVDWDQAYNELLENDPAVRAKVEKGNATKEDVITWMKGQAKRKLADQGANTKQIPLTAFKKKLKELVQAGKLTRLEAAELLGTMINSDDADKQVDDPSDTLEALGRRLKAAVKAGEITAEDAKAKFQKASMRRGGKGKGSKTRGDDTDFYAIVIGRLKSKDIELGEFKMDVDHVTSMYGNRWVKDEIVGTTVRVSGVSGSFLDKLLQIKLGQTLQVRTGSYRADSDTLGFGVKFHVLERTSPFRPEDYGVPPKDFRGFRGVLQGKVVEANGYEVLLVVDQVVEIAEGSKAVDGNCIQGKRVRVVGFYNQHSKLFDGLHAGDVIRLGVDHEDSTHDELSVTAQLDLVDK